MRAKPFGPLAVATQHEASLRATFGAFPLQSCGYEFGPRWHAHRLVLVTSPLCWDATRASRGGVRCPGGAEDRALRRRWTCRTGRMIGRVDGQTELIAAGPYITIGATWASDVEYVAELTPGTPGSGPGAWAPCAGVSPRR